DPTMMTEYPHAGTWPVEVLTFLIGNRIDAFYIAFVLCACFSMHFSSPLLFADIKTIRGYITPAGCGYFLAHCPGKGFICGGTSSQRLPWQQRPPASYAGLILPPPCLPLPPP